MSASVSNRYENSVICADTNEKSRWNSIKSVPIVGDGAYPTPPTSYPPPEQAYTTTPYVAPPPMGYPTNDTSSYPQQVPSDTKNRGDGFWKGW
ncbi:hypothetical protein KFK09_019886 [Dendrobium nobile]|uniref:Uncharacterized protein n=1 Tax=Dendrobium nobile TaxID=94219 RepID=A0A8T3AQS6_DENNO|nr:hypothetical protein KFK09_019886 [Dendrobium nobile]